MCIIKITSNDNLGKHLLEYFDLQCQHYQQTPQYLSIILLLNMGRQEKGYHFLLSVPVIAQPYSAYLFSSSQETGYIPDLH